MFDPPNAEIKRGVASFVLFTIFHEKTDLGVGLAERAVVGSGGR
jgi:hypothetical protein